MSKFLEVYGANTHNLKNVDVKIPKNKITVITGLSGSGKSSLAFNTIYSVGQQKYLESLSSYARMFVGGMKEEADVWEIKGLSPTISIDQKTTSKNPRSTVGTITEIYDYYKLLFLNIGTRKCVECDSIVKKDSMADIIEFLSSKTQWDKFMVLAPIEVDQKDDSKLYFEEIKKAVLDLGFIRFCDELWNIYTINDDFSDQDLRDKKTYIVVDRLVIWDYSDDQSSDIKRLKDSIELSFRTGQWQLSVDIVGDAKYDFSNIFVCSSCGHIPSELNISSFSFNSHAGACQHCHWLGVQKVFLEENISNPKLTLSEWAIIAPGFGGNYFFALLKAISKKTKIDLDTPWRDLSKKDKEIVLQGTGDYSYTVKFVNEAGIANTYNSRFEWVVHTLARRYFDWGADKGHYDDFVVDMDCYVCDGKRLKKETLSMYIEGKDIWDIAELSVDKAITFLHSLKLTAKQEKITKKVLKNATERLEFLAWVGLTYMTISRKAGTLSGWEAQRIRLATQIGTKLEGIIYVLDEPSIGLHPRDNNMLIDNIKKLRDIGNTVIIVEHDEDIMRHSDHIIDIWPWAGIHGGMIVAEWTIDEIIANKKSITGPFLSGEAKVVTTRQPRPKFAELKKNKKILSIIGATQHNLQNLDVEIPLANLVAVTWVSGSGKSSLINDILSNYLANKLNRAKRSVWAHTEITGLEHLDKTVIIDQSAIWKTPRSNPATYTWVLTPIREVFAMTNEAQVRGYAAGRFSFNTKQGRCDVCDGDGVKKIEMHFLPPVYVECESCEWKRYNRETLQIKYKWKTIADVLAMDIETALEFFASHPRINKILQTINEVGLGYMKLGQSSTTLSGWEAQRIKLSTELSKRSTWKTFYILDEPTTGLHFQDVERLLTILHSLVDKWNSVLVIEHNMEVITNADYIIDIWPEWGDKWGTLMCQGTLDEVKKHKTSYTAEAIRAYYKN